MFNSLQKLDIPFGEGGLILDINKLLTKIDEWTDESEFGILRNKLVELNKSAINIKADILLKPYWALETWLNFLLRL